MDAEIHEQSFVLELLDQGTVKFSFGITKSVLPNAVGMQVAALCCNKECGKRTDSR